MVALRASGDVFSLNGDGRYDGVVHGRVAGGVRLNVVAEAELCHGVDAAAAAGIGADLQASVSWLLPALRASGQAQATAGIDLALQLSPDLFDKVGLTAGIGAVAHASVAGSLALGLDFTDVAAAAADILDGLAYDLFITFLNEVGVEAGVWGLAAVAAMASASLEVNGTLTGDDPGFVVAMGAALGLGAGAGWDFYAGVRLSDPTRMIVNSAQLVTDEVAARARRLLPVQLHGPVEYFELLTPFLLSTAFELGRLSGLELVRWGEQSASAPGPFGEAFRRQLQWFVLDKIAVVGVRLLSHGVESLITDADLAGLDQDGRERLRLTITGLVDALRAGPVTVERLPAVVSAVVELVSGLAPAQARTWHRQLALLWAAVAVGESLRAPTATGSVTTGGVAGEQGLTDGEILTLAVPPPAVRAEFDQVLPGRPDPLRTSDAIDYLLAVGITPLVGDLLPDLSELLTEVGDALGVTAGDVVGAALHAGLGADLTDTELYLALRRFLTDAVEDRLVGDLFVELRAAAGSNDDTLRYLDEVVEPSLEIVTSFVFDSLDRLIDDIRRPAPDDAFFDVLRQGLSAVAFKIVGRNVIVLSDILLAHAVSTVHTGLSDLAGRLADAAHPMSDGALQLVTALLPPGVDPAAATVVAATRELVAELVAAGAVAFGPTVWNRQRRDELRRLLVRLLESVDTQPDTAAMTTTFDQLRECAFIPDPDGLAELGGLLATVTADEIGILVGRVLPALQVFALRLTSTTLDALDAAAHRFVDDVAAAVDAALATLNHWIAEATRLGDLWRGTAQDASAALAAAGEKLRGDALREAILAEVRSRGLDAAADTAALVPGFDLLDANGRALAVAAAQQTFLGLFALCRPAIVGGLDALGLVADGLGGLIAAAADLPDLAAAVGAQAATEIRTLVSDTLSVFGVALPPELTVDDVAAAAHDVINTLAPLRTALDAALTTAVAERDARHEADDAESARVVGRERWQHERDRHADLIGGPLSVEILSPHEFAGTLDANWLYPREVPVLVHVPGARPSFARAGSPRRLLVAVNGDPLTIPPAAWTFDSVAGCMTLTHTLTVANSRLRDGPNVVECSVVDGAGQLVRAGAAFVVDSSLVPRPGTIEIAAELLRVDALGDDHRNTEAEYVALRNVGHQALDLAGWRVQDRAGHSYTFGDFVLQAGAVVRLHTGVGTDDHDRVFWGRSQAVWNNRGDTVVVVDADRLLRAEYSY